MSFRDLYDYCQDKPLHIRRNLVRDRVLELTNVPKIPVTVVGINPAICRGFYLSAKNTDHPMVKQFGGHLIGVARGLNRCWTRFVVVKEMMHLFGDERDAVDSGDTFEKLLQDITAFSGDLSPQLQSEYSCFWMALAVLCPEAKRLEYQAKRAANELDDYAIALELRIPQQYVPRLFEARYRPIVDGLIT